jgi:hypothetical protein
MGLNPSSFFEVELARWHSPQESASDGAHMVAARPLVNSSTQAFCFRLRSESGEQVLDAAPGGVCELWEFRPISDGIEDDRRANAAIATALRMRARDPEAVMLVERTMARGLGALIRQDMPGGQPCRTAFLSGC